MVRSSNGSILLGGAALILLAGVAAADDKPSSSSTAETSPQSPRRLDLRAPDITELYSRDQIERMLGDALEEDQELEEVEVERERERTPPRTPTVWGGPATIFWGLLHPTQAWRIIAPLPPDQTGGPEYDKPDATRGYLEPAAPVHP